MSTESLTQETRTKGSHTPGPWSNERIWDTPASRIHARVEGVPMALAEVFTMRNSGEKEANACLIAAAPDLLEALKLLYKEMELSGNLGSKQYGWPEATTKSQAAIAKAEGRS